MDNQTYKIIDDTIRIPIRAGEHVYIKLDKYVLDTIKNYKLGSVTITPEKLCIDYSG